MTVPLTAVIVAHNSLAELRRTLPPLIAQLGPQDELIVVDNASGDGLPAELPTLAPQARLIEMGHNAGFAAGANAGAAAATGPLLVLLNPDALVHPGFIEEIRAPYGGPFGAWMGLVLLPGGREINTSGGVLHFTGFGWAGRIGAPMEAISPRPADVGFLSGACLAIPLERWHQLKGFPQWFFMYCEDVDLSLRLRLSGARLGVVPAARVTHEYEFAKGEHKWRWLERNRLATIIRTYPGPVLLAVAPALLAAELAVWAFAARGGWLHIKALAVADVTRRLPQLLRERRAIQATRTISPAQFADGLTAELSSPYLGAIGRRPLIRATLTLYWRCARALLR